MKPVKAPRGHLTAAEWAAKQIPPFGASMARAYGPRVKGAYQERERGPWFFPKNAKPPERMRPGPKRK